MSKLTQWLDHRMDVVGVESWKDLSKQSGVAQNDLQDAKANETLDGLSRSERRLLAAVLRVSVRRLEQLNEGRVDWIEDEHVYDAIARGRPLPAQERDPDYWKPKEIQPEDRGTPLVGRIRASGKAEPDEEWNEEYGRFVPRRFGKGHDIYALEIEGEPKTVVLRNIPPWEFREGKAAVYCWNGWDTEGWFGRVDLKATRARVVTADGKCHDLDTNNVVRIGKMVGNWSEYPDGMQGHFRP